LTELSSHLGKWYSNLKFNCLNQVHCSVVM